MEATQGVKPSESRAHRSTGNSDRRSPIGVRRWTKVSRLQHEGLALGGRDRCRIEKDILCEEEGLLSEVVDGMGAATEALNRVANRKNEADVKQSQNRWSEISDLLLEIRNTRQKEKSEGKEAEKARLQGKGSCPKGNVAGGKAATVNSAKRKSNKQVNIMDDLQMANIWAEMRAISEALQKRSIRMGK